MERPRILHLIDPATPGGGACTLRFLAEMISNTTELMHDVLVLGGRGHGAVARRCGLAIDGVICPPLRTPFLARKTLRRAVRQREIERGPYDRVHAWTIPAARLAAAALPRHRRIATPTVGPLRDQIRIERVMRRPTPVFAASTGVADACAAIGIARHELRVLPLAVNGTGPAVESRGCVRDRWGVGEDAFVVVALAEPAGWADAVTAVRVLVRIVASGRPVFVVVHHGAGGRVAAERWVRPTGLRDRVIFDDAASEPWRVLPGADAALVFTSGDPRHSGRPDAGVLPLLGAMRVGVPVIAEATETVRAVIPNDDAGVIVTPGDVNAISAALADLHDDRDAARAIGARGARTVDDAFGFDRYRERLLDAYGIG